MMVRHKILPEAAQAMVVAGVSPTDFHLWEGWKTHQDTNFCWQCRSGKIRFAHSYVWVTRCSALKPLCTPSFRDLLVNPA